LNSDTSCGIAVILTLRAITRPAPPPMRKPTMMIAQAVTEVVEPYGVGVVIEAKHLCMMMRGVEKQNTIAVSSSMLGVFRTQQQTREEFLKLIRGSSVRDGN